MKKYIVMIEDGWNGHATKRILEIVKEDFEYYICQDGNNLTSILLKKKDEYHVLQTFDNNVKYNTCFGIDEKILNYVMLKKKLSEISQYIEMDSYSEKIIFFLEKYQRNYNQLFLE